MAGIKRIPIEELGVPGGVYFDTAGTLSFTVTRLSDGTVQLGSKGNKSATPKRIPKGMTAVGMADAYYKLTVAAAAKLGYKVGGTDFGTDEFSGEDTE